MSFIYLQRRWKPAVIQIDPTCGTDKDEAAHVAELLLSEKGAFPTGADFLVDGGATASYFYDPLQPQTH